MDQATPPAAAPAAHPLSVAQRATLAALLDLMIPASSDGRMPAASTLGLFDDVGGLPSRVLLALAAGLDAVDAAARAAHQVAFAQLGASQRGAIVQQVQSQAVPFFTALTVHSVARYYQHDQVMRLIGMEVRPLWPQGQVVDDGDWSLLDPVRSRARLYRDTDPPG